MLDAGADDYVVKPYSAEHLEARLRAVLRRGGTDDAPRVLVIGGLVIDLDAREAKLDDQSLDLTAREFELLAYLAERAGVVVSKRELLEFRIAESLLEAEGFEVSYLPVDAKGRVDPDDVARLRGRMTTEGIVRTQDSLIPSERLTHAA